MCNYNSLIEAALKARDQAHAPYSEFKVGAAICDSSDQITIGANVESASYGLSCCAERVAITRGYFDPIGFPHHGTALIAADLFPPGNFRCEGNFEVYRTIVGAQRLCIRWRHGKKVQLSGAFQRQREIETFRPTVVTAESHHGAIIKTADGKAFAVEIIVFQPAAKLHRVCFCGDAFFHQPFEFVEILFEETPARKLVVKCHAERAGHHPVDGGRFARHPVIQVREVYPVDLETARPLRAIDVKIVLAAAIVDIRIFGKSEARKFRRMAVCLARGDTIEDAREKAVSASKAVTLHYSS